MHTQAVEKVKSADDAEKERLRKEYEGKVKLLEAHGMYVCMYQYMYVGIKLFKAHGMYACMYVCIIHICGNTVKFKLLDAHSMYACICV